MKKLALLLISILIPSMVSASSINYDITNFLIDAEVLENGDMNMKELIVLDGSFNGYIRELEYKNPKLKEYTPGEINFANSAIYNASGISNVKLFSKKIEKEDKVDFSSFDETYIPFIQTLNEKNAKNGNYVFYKEDDIHSYKMYQSADDETVAFLLSYTVDNAVVMHEDVAELYWNFIGTGFTDKIYNLQIQVHLPNDTHPEEYLFWAHGDITGEIDQIDDQTIWARMKSLEKNTVVDIRAIFDKSIIKDDSSLRHSKEEALDKILEIETKRAEDANKQRELLRLIYHAVRIITELYFILIAVLWIWIYIKFDKEYKSDFNSKYYREFTGNYNVEVIDYLMNKNITPNAMSASIMNLIYKKNIEVEEISNANEKKKKYRFKLKNNQNVTDTEQVLLDFLFERVGKNNEFTTQELEKYAKSSKTCEKFSKSYNEWKNCVIKDAEQERFYENNGIPTVIGIMTLLVAILISLVVIYYHVDFIPSYFLVLVGIVFLFYTILLKKRTRKGNEDYLKWKAFKNFLNDFGNFKIKELPEIALWEKYLVYATIFGLANKVEKSMNVKIAEYPEYETLYANYNPIFDWHLCYILNQSIHTSYTSSIAATSANANSRNSSGAGFGGGFSSGSGFGGGGGGGHGF